MVKTKFNGKRAISSLLAFAVLFLSLPLDILMSAGAESFYDGITLNKTAAIIYVGGGDTLTATVAVAEGSPTIIWDSSKPAIATVSNGVVTGISAGEAVITASVNNKTASCAVTVKNLPSTIVESPPPDGIYGEVYSHNLTATGAGTWSLESGSLPDGLTLSNGTISGTPTKADTFAFTVKASNGDGEDRKALSITISPAVLTFKADDKSVRINTALPTYTYSVSGWKFSDQSNSADIITTEPVFDSTTANIGVPGTYQITKSTDAVISGGNYTAEYSDGVLTVQDKELVEIIGVTARDTTYYGGTHSGYDGTPSISEGTVNFTHHYIGRNTTIYDSDNPSEKVGEYTVIIEVDDVNYFGSISLDFKIEKGNPTATFPTTATAVYGETLAEVSYSGHSNTTLGSFSWASGDAVSVGDAGVQTHNMTFTPNDTSNYNTLTQAVNVEVSPAPLTIMLISFIKTYDGTNAVTSFGSPVFSGLVGEETADVVTPTATYSQATVDDVILVTLNGDFTMTGGNANPSN